MSATKLFDAVNPCSPSRRATGALRPWASALVAIGLAVGVGGCGSSHNFYSYGQCGSACPSAEVSYGVVARDFTGNGLTSVVQTSTILNGSLPTPGNLKAYLSTGPGTFAPPVLTSAGDNPLYLAAADLNGDHLLDIVSASFQDGTLSVFFNNPQNPGSFGTPLLLYSPGASQVAIADMNGDGLPDLVSADYNVSLFLQASPGAFASPVILYPAGANWVAAGDLNGDGIADVALVDGYGVKVLLHTGSAANATYGSPITVYTEPQNAWYEGANVVAIADVDGDGLNDLVITDPGPAGGGAPTVMVLLQNPASHGTFLAPAVYSTVAGSRAESISVVDVNGDGRPDIVIGGTTAVSVLLQSPSGGGTFLPETHYAVPAANEIAVADVNADGLPDIVVATGPPQAAQNGVLPNEAGVLLQSSTTPGTFMPLQSLP